MLVTRRNRQISAFVFAVSAPAPVFATMSPGIGLGALGAALGVLVSLLFVLVLVFWTPIRRLMRRSRKLR